MRLSRSGCAVPLREDGCVEVTLVEVWERD